LDTEQLLKQAGDAELLRLTTAGSVDDGKSTLIGRLLHDAKGIYEDHLDAVERDSERLNREETDLALLTDGLQAEREQGITIDVAYRYFSTPRRRFIIADTPGHVQYTRNMATGASTANLAIILIDAANGVTTQSKRHGFIASLLGIGHVVLAVNKMDLVDYSEEVFQRLRSEYIGFAARLNVKDLTCIPVSALKGDNVVQRSERMPWYPGVPLLTHLETVFIAADRNLIDFRFPVQYVNRPLHDFRGYCGQVVSGVIRPGDEVMVLPSGKTSRVERIVTYDGELAHAFPPQSVTICLEDELDVSRGDMLVRPRNRPRVTSRVEAMLVWMSETRFLPGSPYFIKHTTTTVRGESTALHYRIDPDHLHRQEATTLQLNEIGRVVLQLYRPIVCDNYSRNRGTGSFIVIDPTTNSTVAAGMIIDRGGRRAGRRTKPASRHITRSEGLVSAEEREQMLGGPPATIWLTGLSGSGKTAIAMELERRLIDSGRACCVLDGDNVRHGLSSDLGFSPEDRSENIRRIAEVARLFNEAGMTVVTAFISPYRADRGRAAEIIGKAAFVEVFVDSPLEVCEARDRKGLYKKARSGEIPEFTGISAPYEAPETPAVHLLTDTGSVDEMADRIQHFLES